MNLFSLLLLAIGLNLIGFGLAYDAATDKLTVLSYGATFLVLALLQYLKGGKSTPQNLLMALVAIWAVRLAGYLVLRILMIDRDRRFDNIRKNFSKFGQFWVGQAIAAWVILLPAFFILNGNQAGFGKLTLVGWIVAVLGLSLESAADAQKYNFNLEPKNDGKFINKGLWRLSRHPNYFGEIMVWVGVYIYCFNFMTTAQRIVGLLSPLLISYLIIKVTGMPRLEAYADKKWGRRANYQKYKSNASVLIPLPPKNFNTLTSHRSAKSGSLD